MFTTSPAISATATNRLEPVGVALMASKSGKAKGKDVDTDAPGHFAALLG